MRQNPEISAGRRSSFFASVLLLVAIAISGCGGDEPAPKEKATKSPKSTSTKTKSSQKKQSASKKSSSRHVRTDADGKKWVGDIPYDVFFDDPLTVASNSTSVAPANNGNTPAPSASESPAPAGSGTAAGMTDDWKSVVSMEILEAEVKRIRNSMTGNLQAVSQYNAGYKELQIDGGTLAAVAAIIIEHPDSISWKEDAKYMRDLGTSIEEHAQKLGKKSFDATAIPYEQFLSILNRSKAPDIPEAEEKVPFADRADRGTLMRRLDNAFNTLKANVTTEAALEKEKETVLHESGILVALTKVIMHESYDLADDEDYLKLCQEMYDAGKSMEASVAGKDFDAYDSALSKILNSCTQCHTSYRD